MHRSGCLPRTVPERKSDPLTIAGDSSRPQLANLLCTDFRLKTCAPARYGAGRAPRTHIFFDSLVLCASGEDGL